MLPSLRLAGLLFFLVTLGQRMAVANTDDFSVSLLDVRAVDGQIVQWDSSARLHVFCFLGCECPVARLYAGRLQEMARRYDERGVRFVGVMSNLHDSIGDIRAFSKQMGMPFPLIKDTVQSLAKHCRVTRTPEVVVLDSSGNVVYRGRIDDQYAPGAKRSSPTTRELADALESHLAGKSIAVSATEPVGCLITWENASVENPSVTFCKDVAPIAFRRCYECHRPGEIGPFDISDLNEVRGWASMILEVVAEKRMPPWHANPEHGSFKNARYMPDEEVAVLRAWVDAGAPLGDPQDMPEKPASISGWRLPKEPDLVVAMGSKPFPIPASGSVEYQYFVVDPQLDSDRWVSAAQVVPGNPSVVHHAIAFIRPPDGTDMSGIGWLTAYVPGQRATLFPPGYARKVPAGSKFVFQMHYTPNGAEQSDLTQVGVNWIDASEVTHEVFTVVGLEQDFEIPPHARHHSVESDIRWFPKYGSLLAASPHMHLRGKSFQLVAKSQAGTSVLLDVPKYDFNWQHTYEWSEPLPLNSIESLTMTAGFDNSSHNPSNPNAAEYVMWGDQTWEEMAVAFLEVTRPVQHDSSNRAARSTSGPKTNAPMPDASPESIRLADEFADEFLKRFDRDGNKKVSRDEVSNVIRLFSFYRFDHNRDQSISRDELISTFSSHRGR
jgi:hypothetical protein